MKLKPLTAVIDPLKYPLKDDEYFFLMFMDSDHDFQFAYGYNEDKCQFQDVILPKNKTLEDVLDLIPEGHKGIQPSMYDLSLHKDVRFLQGDCPFDVFFIVGTYDSKTEILKPVQLFTDLKSYKEWVSYQSGLA